MHDRHAVAEAAMSPEKPNDMDVKSMHEWHAGLAR